MEGDWEKIWSRSHERTGDRSSARPSLHTWNMGGCVDHMAEQHHQPAPHPVGVRNLVQAPCPCFMLGLNSVSICRLGTVILVNSSLSPVQILIDVTWSKAPEARGITWIYPWHTQTQQSAPVLEQWSHQLTEITRQNCFHWMQKGGLQAHLEPMLESHAAKLVFNWSVQVL